MRCLVAIVLALLASVAAYAAGTGTALVKWGAVTTLANGKPLPAGSTPTYNVYQSEAGATAIKVQSGLTALSATFTALNDSAKYCYTVTASVPSLSIPESAQSAPPACKTMPDAPSPPAPPSGVTVAVVTGVSVSPVFGVNTHAQRLEPVLGFVPLGTACIGTTVYTYRGQGYKYVPQTAVKWWATTPTQWALAACS